MVTLIYGDKIKKVTLCSAEQAYVDSLAIGQSDHLYGHSLIVTKESETVFRFRDKPERVEEK